MLRKTDSRDRILSAALSLLETMDYEEITAERIISVSGVAKQTFYNHFSDKQQAYAELSVLELLRVTQEMVDKACKHQDANKRIESFLRDCERYLRSNSDVERTLVREGVLRKGDTAAMKDYIAKIMAQYLRLIDPAVASSQWPSSITKEFFLEVLTSAVNSLATNYGKFHGYPITQHRKMYAQLLCKVVHEGI